MNYREFQRVLRDNVSFNFPEKSRFYDQFVAVEEPTEFVRRPRINLTKRLVFAFSSLMFALIIASGIYFQFDTYAVMTIDINPSLAVDINRFDKVIDITGLNSDGETLVESLSKKRGDIDQVFAAIDEAVVDLGYRASGPGAVLIGVNAGSYAVEAKLLDKVQDSYVYGDTLVALVQKHTETTESLYFGFASISAESIVVTTTAAPYISTTMAYPDSSTMAGTADYLSPTTTQDAQENTNDTPVTTITTSEPFYIDYYSESEFEALAEAYGITEARLQVAMQVFEAYDDFQSVADFEALVNMALIDLIELYNGID
ncbi:MAG: hypothetical protein JXB20_02830 [Bacilli bacterium]|nr:hypothetical protein [Bacilli bacterium]